jgi:hypothetical protein
MHSVVVVLSLAPLVRRVHALVISACPRRRNSNSRQLRGREATQDVLRLATQCCACSPGPALTTNLNSHTGWPTATEYCTVNSQARRLRQEVFYGIVRCPPVTEGTVDDRRVRAFLRAQRVELLQLLSKDKKAFATARRLGLYSSK